MVEPRASALDTSFWAATALAEAHGYLLKLFEVHCAEAVVLEIENEEPPALRTDAALFQQLRLRGVITVTDPRSVTVKLFGKGEAATLSLAAERQWIALINEYRAAEYGRNAMKLIVMNVPQLIVAACAAGHVPSVKAQSMLAKIANITSPRLIQEATRVLAALP